MKIKVICLFFTALVFFTVGINAQQVNAPVGGSIEQIVAFYNQHANTVKSAGRVTITKNSVREVDLNIPLLLRPFVPNNVMESLRNQSTRVTETFVNGIGTSDAERGINDFLPVAGTPNVSYLSPSHVISATCISRGSDWVVTIRLRNEPLDTIFNTTQTNSRSAEDMSEAEREALMADILSRSGYVSSMELQFDDMQDNDDTQQSNTANRSPSSMSGGFQDGVITAVFNQEGRLLSLTHSYNMNMSFRALLMNARINIASRREYQFIYPMF